MDTRTLLATTLIAAAIATTGCNDAPKTAPETATKKVELPPEPVAGKNAFYLMYKPARTWAPDLMPLSMASDEVPGHKNEGGKAWKWTAVFVSPSKRAARTYTYATVDEGPTVHKGVTELGASVWSRATPKSKPFQINEMVVNSDTAYQTAAEKAAAWLKQNPDKHAEYMLASENRFSSPVWYIVWGDKKSGYVAFISATTGAPMNK